MRVTKVYTRHGDGGTTRLVGNQVVDKSCQRIEAFGSVDELNSMTGLVKAFLEEGREQLPHDSTQRILAELDAIQNWLFVLGGDLATLIADRWPDMPVITKADTALIEKRIDAMNADLPPLEEFILPGGTLPAAALHVARTLCRRAEREVIRLSQVEAVGDAVIPFLNRLSDYLFVMARWISRQSGHEEPHWKRENLFRESPSPKGPR